MKNILQTYTTGNVSEWKETRMDGALTRDAMMALSAQVNRQPCKETKSLSLKKTMTIASNVNTTQMVMISGYLDCLSSSGVALATHVILI